MKINYFNNLAFQKTLCAKAGVLVNGKSEKCNIYKLNQEEDLNYFDKCSKDKNWKNDRWIFWVEKTVKKLNEMPQKNIFVIENQNKDCLGYIETEMQIYRPKDKSLPPINCTHISFLETAPNLKNNDENNQITHKYIGETLFAFICKLSNKKNIPCIKLNSLDNSVGFYDKCNCTYIPVASANFMIIDENNYKKTIKQNEKHTGKRMQLYI